MKQRLDAAFKRIDSIDITNIELRSDFAKYLCVLVSGYIEAAIAQIIQEHARRNGSLSLQRFVGSKVDKFTNAKPQKIIDLLGSFKIEWRYGIEEFLDHDRKEAINNIITNRHRIAHGRDSQITFSDIRSYYEEAQKVILEAQRLCLDGG